MRTRVNIGGIPVTRPHLLRETITASTCLPTYLPACLPTYEIIFPSKSREQNERGHRQHHALGEYETTNSLLITAFPPG